MSLFYLNFLSIFSRLGSEQEARELEIRRGIEIQREQEERESERMHESIFREKRTKDTPASKRRSVSEEGLEAAPPRMRHIKMSLSSKSKSLAFSLNDEVNFVEEDNFKFLFCHMYKHLAYDPFSEALSVLSQTGGNTDGTLLDKGTNMLTHTACMSCPGFYN